MSRFGFVILASSIGVFHAQQTDVPVTPVLLKTVTGIPFSARVSTQTAQNMTDGNRVVRENTSLVARDSDGRTRREQVVSGSRSIIFITDPVNRSEYLLDSQSHSARVFSIPHDQHATPYSDTVAPGSLLCDTASVATEQLGTEIFDGVAAEGTRTTCTVPGGKIGNERPFQIVSERWYSSELQTVIVRTVKDPRIGQTTYQLTNVKREEPNRSLFEVPQNYRQSDVKSDGR